MRLNLARRACLLVQTKRGRGRGRLDLVFRTHTSAACPKRKGVQLVASKYFSSPCIPKDTRELSRPALQPCAVLLSCRPARLRARRSWHRAGVRAQPATTTMDDYMFRYYIDECRVVEEATTYIEIFNYSVG